MSRIRRLPVLAPHLRTPLGLLAATILLAGVAGHIGERAADEPRTITVRGSDDDAPIDLAGFASDATCARRDRSQQLACR